MRASGLQISMNLKNLSLERFDFTTIFAKTSFSFINHSGHEGNVVICINRMWK